METDMYGHKQKLTDINRHERTDRERNKQKRTKTDSSLTKSLHLFPITRYTKGTTTTSDKQKTDIATYIVNRPSSC